MKADFWPGVLAMLVIATAASHERAQTASQRSIQTTDPPTESDHRRGPDGFEGHTLNYSVTGYQSQERFPMTLVIVRNGHVLSRIEGEPFVWKWIFWQEGRKVAYEAAPFHGSLDCVLADSTTGRRLASYDCFHGIPKNAPAWLTTLESSP